MLYTVDVFKTMISVFKNKHFSTYHCLFKFIKLVAGREGISEGEIVNIKNK